MSNVENKYLKRAFADAFRLHCHFANSDCDDFVRGVYCGQVLGLLSIMLSSGVINSSQKQLLLNEMCKVLPEKDK